MTVFDREIRTCPGRSNVQTLIVSRSRLAWPGAHSCSEVLDFLNGVGRKESLAKASQIEPFVWSSPQRSVVEIESVYVNVDLSHAFSSLEICRAGRASPVDAA